MDQNFFERSFFHIFNTFSSLVWQISLAIEHCFLKIFILTWTPSPLRNMWTETATIDLNNGAKKMALTTKGQLIKKELFLITLKHICTDIYNDVLYVNNSSPSIPGALWNEKFPVEGVQEFKDRIWAKPRTWHNA